MSAQQNKQGKKSISSGAKWGWGIGLGAVGLIVILGITMFSGASSNAINLSGTSGKTITLSKSNFDGLCTKLWQTNLIFKWYRFDNVVPTNQLNSTYQEFVKPVSSGNNAIYAPISQNVFQVNIALKQYANFTISSQDVSKGTLFFFKNGLYRQNQYLINNPNANVQYMSNLTISDWVMFQPKGETLAYLVKGISFDSVKATASGLFGVSYTIQ
jgi:hypothetical protein